MKTFTCEICGDAYIGAEKPSDCPFCGAPQGFIKPGNEAKPIVDKEISPNEEEKDFLLQTLKLETRATSFYLCIAGKTSSSEVRAMYKRLAKIEREHASIVTKILKIEKAEIVPEECSDDDVANFKATIELEDHAVILYVGFAKKSKNADLRILFTALAQAERAHVDLLKNY